MHVIYLPFSHFLWCAFFSWFIDDLSLIRIFFNCILSIGVSIFLINLHCFRWIICHTHSILVSFPPILFFEPGYYSIPFIQVVWHPPIECWIVRYLIGHRILSQSNRFLPLDIFNIHPCCCLLLPFNQDLPTFFVLLGDIGVLTCEAIILCDWTTISSVVYNLTHDQILVSLAI